MEALLKLSNIKYSYHTLQGEIPAIMDISFHVNPGEFLAIVGPSGCGKSTLLSIIARMLEPEEGTILVHNPNGSLSYPKMGYMLQKDHLLPWRTIWENVTLGPEISHTLTKEREEKLLMYLEKYGLSVFKDRKPNELSGGMRQRAALVRTLALDPEVLLLDEPFSALDYQTRLSVVDDIGKIIKEEGKTAILVTHDLSEAISLSDRIVVLSKRPSTVSTIMEIHLTKDINEPLSSRKAKEFPMYFDLLWKELNQ